ncbi:MAG TPA: polysaccharide deacetylase family protein [Bryobacteraceae bacterium]|nr:polysaccharide deacetylase family protein [Bryobacteraceae bacterium]
MSSDLTIHLPASPVPSGLVARWIFARRGYNKEFMDLHRQILPVTLAGGVCVITGGMAWAVRGRSSSVFGASVWRGPRERRAVALTFDDGPSEQTPQILEILARHGVTATFFQCGANVERLPAVARAVHQAGHEIGNHSHTHPMLCFRSAEFIACELARAQEAIALCTGTQPRWFRAPFGVRWFGMREAQAALGLTGVMWTVIGYDWKLKANAVVKRMAGGAANGAILCLHDGRELRAGPDIGATVEAVRSLVPLLLDRGYEFETVSRLLCPTN